ncbi:MULTISPECIES: hypothetical protein [unclassified Corallococcus]|uniref:hypothetical protein n=1 Tax=unclassified Corallococcus TaxID=2685029 RepID=UPI001A909D36|nr:MULTISPECIES: hypothetical protein [unclassified Corallococcus]MBN9687439.1 hypothetical protein [Corallococcus sp. NCSPR001]WAS88738.1 hypothetical protein O0N60_17530 [Corallococcus sp. NCRR]
MPMSPRWAVSAVLLMAGFLACGAPSAPEPVHTDAVNLILGDASFQARFGRLPTEEDDEDLRIRVHLEHVLGLLRQRRPEGLSATALAARTHQLERLEAYIRRGEFPRNDGHPDARRPTFIDSAGRICAVGFLLEQDLGRSAAEAIAAGYKYAFIREIDSPLLKRWAATTGLTREELELIQPSYNDTREGDYGPFFAMLEQADGRGNVAIASGLLFDGRGDGVPVRLDLSVSHFFGQFIFEGKHRLGWYADGSVTKLTGAARAASALSNLDVGLAWAWSPSFARYDDWLVLKSALLLPTGDEDALGAGLNASVAAQRPTQAVLFQPGALGGRVGPSFLHTLYVCACDVRLDVGVDGYLPFQRGFQLSPRWGAGLAYRLSSFAATLEVAGARYAQRGSESAFHHSVGGSFRYAMSRYGFTALQPGVYVSVPLEGRLARAFVGIDLVLRD